MRHFTTKIFTQRLKFIHIVALVSLMTSAQASEVNLFKAFNPNYKIQDRNPGSFTPDVDYTPEPDKIDNWYNYILVEDDKGELEKIKRKIDSWEKEESYVEMWDLESTGEYNIKTSEEKKAYLGKHILRYFDKRLSGQVKKAEEGSALASVGKAQKALRPNTSVGVSKNVKIKFRAKVLRGLAVMRVINPYVDYNATYSLSSGLRMNLSKNFKSFRTIASLRYNPKESNYIAFVDKKITTKISARVSSSQAHDKAIFDNDSDSRFSLRYSAPFNF